jgi:Zn-dependent protease
MEDMQADEAVVTRAAAALPEVPPPRAAPTVQADDHGAFRAVDPVSGTAVVIRPQREALELHGSTGLRRVPWAEIRRVALFDVQAHTTRVAAARLVLESGECIAIARMHTAGAGYLPVLLEPDALPLIRVERMRLLTAAIIARAGLHEIELGVFERGPRLEPMRDITPRPRLLPEWAPPLLLLLSVVGLVLVFDLTLAAAAVVTMVLLVHEYGHVIAMRVLGLRVRGVLFLPLLGAATVPEQAFPTRWDEARVALAGPMTALPMALTAVLLWHSGLISDELGRDAFVWSLALNALNLLPLMPLDGGRALLTLTASLRPLTRRVIQFAPVVLSAAALLTFLREPVGFAVGAFVVFSGAVTRLAFRRQSVHAWMEDSGIDLTALRTALRDVTHGVSGVAREDVDGGVPPAPMTGAQATGVIVVYLVEIVSIFGIVVAAARWPGLFGV